ncbi:putative awp1 [Toxoplasma gondii TgCatPRC2]|uniref:Putative awp1 n=1 Tax=Toxoplasma gondii TgCatPRC2 TaxID=1130821 RepID=A0A151HIA8_TOXGO|nr:putative awp1 [Toxoplasma gondii TgCatPRC2]
MAAFLLRLLRSLEKWKILQDQAGASVNEALNLLVDRQFLLGDFLVTLQTDASAREKILFGHKQREDAVHQQVLRHHRDLALTHAEIAECARQLVAASKGASRKPSSAVSRSSQFPSASSGQSSQGKRASARGTAPLSPAPETLFLEEIGAFAAEVEEAYRLQLDLQNRLIDVYRERLSPFDRDEMQRILAVWMDRPCEWSVARGGRRQTILRELKKHLRLPI